MSLQSSVSALQSFSRRLDVQANNVANVNTNEFNRGRTLMQEQQPEGVQNKYDVVDSQGPLVPDTTSLGSDLVELSNVELAEEMPQSMISLRALQANAPMVKTQNEMLGTLLDMKA